MNGKGFITGLFLMAVLSFLVTTVALAQQDQRPQPPTPESMVADIEKAITLTADQKTKILKIYTDAAAQAEQQGRRNFFSGVTTEVEKVLTAEQVKTLRAYTLKKSVDRRMTMIDEAVTLTAEQKTKLKPILEKEVTAQTELMAKMRAEGENADRDAFRAKMTALRDSTNVAIQPILTKEQLEKYKNMPQRGPGGPRQ
jgi:hypothetical protein